MKYVNIIPLIGGMTLANKSVVKSDPYEVLSYDAFHNNEKHLLNYLPNLNYKIINDDLNEIIEDVEFVSTVCPCAGLSMLNSEGKSNKKRGGDAVQNEWMYKTANYVLSNLHPKVFWGENAPGLYTNLGLKVVENFKEIAKKFGYSLSIVKTSTILHGIPQDRIRSFYFFWKSDKAPILNYYNKEYKDFLSYINEVKNIESHSKDFMVDKKPSEWFLPYKFVLNRLGLNHKEFVELNQKLKFPTVFIYIDKNNLWDELIDWLKVNDQKITDKSKNSFLSIVLHIKSKLNQGKGYWDNSPHFPLNGKINALIGKNMYRLVHPEEDRFLNIREMLHLMGLPNDFTISDIKDINHIAQNVPVTTAADFTNEVVKFINGKLKLSEYNFLKQNEIKQKIEYYENFKNEECTVSE